MVRKSFFSPDGKQIVTASFDNTAKVWDIKGNLLATLGHQGSVINASFSPDGKRIVTASFDNIAKVWNGVDTNLDRLIKRGCDMMRDYLTTNPNAKEEDRQMCGIVKH
jgi:WD40 repeat protein